MLDKFFRRAAGLWLALLLAASSTFAQQTGAPAPPPPTGDEARPEPSSATSYSAQAAALVSEFEVNGLKVIVKRRPGSQTAVAGLFIRGGAQNVTPETAGVEAVMLDAASEATKSFPRERLRKELARMGAGISYGVNYDYSALTLATTRFNFDRAWEIFTDVALRPSFTDEDVSRVRNRMAVGLRNSKDVPDAYLQTLQARVAYAGHPYLNDPTGTPETISRLTPDDVRKHYQRVMQTSRLLIVLVGDFDPAVIRERVAATFGRLPRGDYKPQPLPQLSFTAQTVDVTPVQLPTNYVQGVYVAPPLVSPDIYPMRVAQTILQSRVYLEVRQKRNLSYAPDAFLYSQGANLGGLYVTATDANQSVRVMLNEVGRLQSEQVSEQELQGTVQFFLTRYYQGQETSAAQVGELAQYELIGGGWRNAFAFLERLRAVTPGEVQRVARTYMRNMRFVVLGDPRAVDRTVFTGQSGE